MQKQKKRLRERGLRFVKPPTIDASTLRSVVGGGHRLLTPVHRPATGLMQGHFSNLALRTGMNLHCTDIVQLQDMDTQQPTHDEGIKVLVRLQGQASVFWDDQPLPFVTRKNACCTAQAAVLALRAPATFRRHARAGEHQRMVVLTVAPSWLEAAQLDLPQRLHMHLSMRCWQPSARAIAITEQLLHPLAIHGPMARLHQESRALELIAEALAQLMPTDAVAPPPLPASVLARMQRLQDLLDSGEADAMDMHGIAQCVGSNATTLQQQFRQLHGQTIFDYLRSQRLQRAATALQLRGISIAEAAETAGYTSQANFSTAFRRQFGFSPKHARQRL